MYFFFTSLAFTGCQMYQYLVSIINDVYRINCQMLVGGKKGRFSIASKSVVVLKNNNYNRGKKQCVLQDAI